MTKYLAKLVLRYPIWFALTGSILALPCAYFSAELYRNLRPDIEELLPTTARSVKDLDHLAERLETFDNLVILVFTSDKGAARRYVDDLTAILRKVPRDTIARVEHRIDKEVQFFKDRQALYIDVPQLEKIRDYVHERIVYEKTIRNPVRLLPLDSLKEPVFDSEGLKKSVHTDVDSFTRFQGGYYSTEDEKVFGILVYMPGKGLENAHRMKKAIDESVAKLDTKAYAPDLQVKYTGNVENLIEESAALIADLEFSTVVVMILVFGAMFLFYRSPWATSAVIGSLIVGVLWTFGLCYFLVGYLNANTAFLASIVIGNGINFGIIFLARYLEERRRGESTESAIEIAVRRTATATGTAALGAGLSYGALMFTAFRGFSQFGVIGLTGMILCWISAYTVLPAYLILIERWIGPSTAKAVDRHPVMEKVAFLVDRYAMTICVVVVAASVLSIASLKNVSSDMIETDLSQLRDKESMSRGSGALYHYIDEIFGHSASPTLVMPKTREDAVKIAALLREEKQAQGKDSILSTVQTLEDFVPHRQAEKIRILRQTQKELDPRILKFAKEKDRKRIRETLNPNAFRLFSEKDLPELLLHKFTERDNSLGKIVVVDKRTFNGVDDSRGMARFVSDVRRVADSVKPGTAVASEMAVTYDMYEAIVHDGPRVTMYALIFVVLLITVLFHNVKMIALALFALGLGILWFAGIILGFHTKLNFLNFIALPITFGIGIDYGVNIFQRYRENGASGILDVIRHSGAAVLLCSLTTIIGYSSLLMAGNRAFVSFGLLAVIGELTCVIAAVVALPAYLRLRHRDRNSKFRSTGTAKAPAPNLSDPVEARAEH